MIQNLDGFEVVTLGAWPFTGFPGSARAHRSQGSLLRMIEVGGFKSYSKDQWTSDRHGYQDGSQISDKITAISSQTSQK